MCSLGEQEKSAIINMSQCTDHFGKKLDYIMIIPLFGKKNKFTNVYDALDFIEKIPRTTLRGQLIFMYYEIIIQYQNGNEIKMRFQAKEDVVDFIRYLFDV